MPFLSPSQRYQNSVKAISSWSQPARIAHWTYSFFFQHWTFEGRDLCQHCPTLNTVAFWGQGNGLFTCLIMYCRFSLCLELWFVCACCREARLWQWCEQWRMSTEPAAVLQASFTTAWHRQACANVSWLKNVFLCCGFSAHAASSAACINHRLSMDCTAVACVCPSIYFHSFEPTHLWPSLFVCVWVMT